MTKVFPLPELREAGEPGSTLSKKEHRGPWHDVQDMGQLTLMLEE